MLHSLSVPRHNLSFGSRAFRISAPKIWNSLPPHILQSQTLSSFRRHLKTHYFQSAYHAHVAPTRDAIAWWLACCTNDREVGVRVPLAAGGPVSTMGQLLFVPWAWVYSTLHPFMVGK